MFVSMFGRITSSLLLTTLKFKDFLDWNNNWNALPFVETVEKMKEKRKKKQLFYLLKYSIACGPL